jgi:serine/threonine protein kinase/tetratricopeptide (TPR) repeat protein
MIGKTLDRYTILREIGRGAMGQVYLALDSRLSRRVALKMLPPAVAADAGRRRRFARESQVLAALNHPNIVTIHSVDEVDDQPFLVMEWIQGLPLGELIPPEGLPPERFLAFAVPLAAAIAQAHQAGIVHRDLKPGNVMVREDGVIKVVDFGISRVEPATVIDGGPEPATLWTEDLTAEGVVIGTVPYMSPEQVQGREVDSRSDVFSLGIVLYEMATGRLPFKGANPAEVVGALLFKQPPAPSSLNPSLPDAVDRIVERCLAKRADDRYPTAAELHRDLLAVGRDTEPPPPLAPLPAFQSVGPGGFASLSSSHGMSTAVAVLPLRNLAGDAAQDYFSDGLTEAMIASLAKIGSMRVISRSSVMRYKIDRPEPRQVARELSVHYLLEGSVLRSGEELMLMVSLVDPASDGVVWGDTYRGSLPDVFAFQQTVAREVARAVKGDLSSNDRSRLEDLHEVSAAVYETYLKARYLLNKRAPEPLREALALLERVVVEAPRYALGWAAKAECYLYMVADGTNVLLTREGLPKARAAAERALALDPRLSEAHAVIGYAHLQSWQWGSVESAFVRALELNPSNADACMKYSMFLTCMGRHDEARTAIQKARRLDPLSLLLRFGFTANYLFAGRYDEAAESAEATIALQPEHWLGYYHLGNLRGLQGRLDEADATLRRAVELGRRIPLALAALGRNEALLGRADEARRLVAELEAASADHFVPPSTLATPLYALGEVDRALGWLEKGIEIQDQNLAFLKVHPHYLALHAHPRFRALLVHVGLAPES